MPIHIEIACDLYNLQNYILLKKKCEYHTNEMGRDKLCEFDFTNAIPD